ncbi:hypothetical protein CNR22_01270 [Sphingobacteriaceae bacterium]|nr:hypothetical protein CNR22_01270 [Sphingobacteriaceae bacterium]
MKRHENALKVAENTDAMLAYWDKNLLCKFANASYLKWFGISPQQMIDKITLPELLGELYEKNLPYIQGALAGKPQTFKRDITLPNGELKTTIATYNPEIENGIVIGFYVHVADISPLKNPFEDFTTKENLKDLSASEVLLNKVEHTLRASLFTEFPGIETLATLHFISATKLKRDFKKRYKSTIFSYYRSLQMQIAEKYLKEKIYTKNQVASILGFENPSNFYTCYQKYLTSKAKFKTVNPVVLSKDISTEEHYQLFIHQAPTAIAMLDRNFNLIGASQKWFEFYKHDSKHALGQNITTLFPQAAGRWEGPCIKCLHGEVCRGEGALSWEDGRQAWLRWEMKPWYVKSQEIGGIIIFTEDITQLKEQLEELKIQVQSFQHISRFLKIGTWERNFDTQKTTWNTATKEILELPTSFEPNLAPALNFYKEGVDRDRAKQLFDDAFIKGTPFDVEMNLVTALGNEKKVRIVGFSHFENGICKRLYGTFQELKPVKKVR